MLLCGSHTRICNYSQIKVHGQVLYVRAIDVCIYVIDKNNRPHGSSCPNQMIAKDSHPALPPIRYPLLMRQGILSDDF